MMQILLYDNGPSNLSCNQESYLKLHSNADFTNHVDAVIIYTRQGIKT